MEKTLSIAFMVEGAVTPAGHYSHAVVANGFVYVSGQGPANPSTGKISPVFSEQVRQTLQNLDTILQGVGSGLKNVVKVNVFLSDVTRFEEYNAVYREFFPQSPPARTTVGSQLIDILIEIDCVATLS